MENVVFRQNEGFLVKTKHRFGFSDQKDIQCLKKQKKQSPVYDMKWGHFDKVNSTFKMLLSSWNFDTVFKKFRSFDAENLGSVD